VDDRAEPAQRPALRAQLDLGGPLVVHGLQGNPADMVRPANEPPATSYFVDYDDKSTTPAISAISAACGS